MAIHLNYLSFNIRVINLDRFSKAFIKENKLRIIGYLLLNYTVGNSPITKNITS